jgi:hypothetical protein
MVSMVHEQTMLLCWAPSGQSQGKGFLANHREEDSWPITGKRILGQPQGRGFLANNREEDSWPLTAKGITITNSVLLATH